MAKNTNRDYLVVIDVKRSNIISQDELIFYINDNESHNIFINLVVEDTKEPMAKYVPVDDIGKYKLVINIVKPTNEYEILEAELISAEDALYQIKLPDTCMNYIGSYKCEVETHYNNRITNSNKFKYKVKKSVLNDLDNIVEAPEYPLVIQLFDKLSDINQYEEERRQNEVARIAAEIARANTFNALQNDMQDSIEAIDSKALDMENRTATMENKINTLITDTKANLDIYKTTKDAQINQSISSMESTIDAYKNEKDQQINAAIQAQDTAIAEAKAAQDTAIEEAITTQNNTINTAISNQNTTINNAITTQNNRITTIESNNTVQNERLETLETTDVAHGTRLDNIEAVNITQNNRLTTVEAKNVEQDNRLDAIEIKNQQQDNRLLAIEKHDEKQDIDIKCLFSTVDTIDVTKEGNDITLQNSKLGFAVIDEIDGNTMVNCNKEADKTLVLNGNINTSGYSNITLTDGVDSGLVDVALEGNTMVNVCDQKDPVAITKSYTVETGNHVALQGEYDGKCRPVVTGNTLVNLAKFKRLSSGGNISVSNNIVTFDNSTTSGSCDFTLNAMKSNTTYTVIFNVLTMFDTGELRLDLFPDTYQELQEQSTIGLKILTFTTPEDISTLECFRFYVNGARTGICKVTYPIILEGDYTNKPIPGYFEGLQSSFEDNLVTQEMVDAGEELAENLGKYKVEYKVTGKNKIDLNSRKSIDSAKISIDNNIVTHKGNGYADIQFWIYLYNDKQYTLSYNASISRGCKILKGKQTSYVESELIAKLLPGSTFTINSTGWYSLHFAWGETNNNESTVSNIQLEEGSTATAYEPYKEQVKTYYLNSPLLEGDTIEESGGNVVHVHRYKKVLLDNNYLTDTVNNGNGTYRIDTTISNYKSNGVIIADLPVTENLIVENDYDKAIGKWNSTIFITSNTFTTANEFKNYLQSNPLTMVYELASPQYEVISQNDTILCDSYVNGHLDVDSAVPVEKVEFKYLFLELKYLYPDTTYNIQFEADNVGDAGIILGNKGWQHLGSVNKGLNKFTYITNSNPTSYMGFQGIGFNASNIVVTEATDQEFGYFEGMKSVGECEDLEVVSRNKNLLDLKNPVNLGYILAKMEGDKIVFNSSGVQGERVSIAFPVYLRKGSTYRFSYSNIEGNPDILGNTLQMHPNLSSAGQFSVSIANPFTWNKDSGIYYARIYNMFVAGTVKTNIQLEENDIATSYTEPQSYTQQLTHEPLRAVGNVKDRYVLIDGKWYIERNTAEVVFDGSADEGWALSTNEADFNLFFTNSITNHVPNTASAISDKYIKKTSTGVINSIYCGNAWKLQILKDKSMTLQGFKDELRSKPLKVIYQLATPTYEPIDYSPFTVYSDVTHISNNSTIPANMVIKNTGYNCMLKPSTTYTVSSNQGVNVITTPSTLTEDCLRFYDSDTSTVTTMKDVLVLEGDYTVNGKPMPSHFPGIESAFEQEYDVVVGKYKVKAKVRNEEGTKEHSIEFYIDEPLRGVGDVKDKVYSDSDNIVIQRNCSVITFDGSNDEPWGGMEPKGNNLKFGMAFEGAKEYETYKHPLACDRLPTNPLNFDETQCNVITLYKHNSHQELRVSIPEATLSSLNVLGFRQWLSENPTTIVYHLASPTYEVIDYPDAKLLLDIFPNSTLYYENNVPVTSTVRYTYSVPLNDAVATVSDISDQQDSMIIDMATQVAVMEMMLM